MKISEFFERFVFVRRCVGCSELVGYNERNDAFCPSCRVRFEIAKTEECPRCGRAAVECECMPKKMSKSGALTLKKLILYKPEKASEPQNRLLYFIKHNRNRRVARFVAEQLSHRVYELIRESGEKKENFVLVFIPRTARAVTREGFDQSELVLLELADIVSLPVERALVRKKRGREQKALTSYKRDVNAQKDIILSENAKIVPEKSYIVFDDIVTSGASMARASEILHSAGAHRIYGMCIAFNV